MSTVYGSNNLLSLNQEMKSIQFREYDENASSLATPATHESSDNSTAPNNSNSKTSTAGLEDATKTAFLNNTTYSDNQSLGGEELKYYH